MNKRIRSTLSTTSDLFFSFMNHGPFASYIKDADGRMVFYNKFLAEASGVSEEEWIGQTDEEIWPEEMAAKFRQNDLEVLAINGLKEHCDVSPRADGSYAFWKTIKFPYTTQEGKRMLAGISMDVTEEVMREAELEDVLRDIRKAIRHT